MLNNQKGAIPLLILIAVIGVVGVLAVSSIAPFRDGMLSSLFPKQSSQAASLTDWPQLQKDPQHTGRTLVSVTPNYEVAWAWVDKDHIVKNFVNAPNKSITDGFEAGFTNTVLFSAMVQPIIADGKVFFGAMNGEFYAVDALTGDNKWDYKIGSAILGTAAYDAGVVVTGSMDGKLYGFDANTGSVKWTYVTNGGISVAPIIGNGIVYAGSRDGNFYAVDLATGALKWKYTTRVEPSNANSPFNAAPIMAPAALSEDGSVVFFGADNMFVYGLNTSNGSEKWVPKKVVGQSFQFAWPVVKGNKVIFRTMSSLEGAEQVTLGDVESMLAAMPDGVGWSEEKTQWLNYLSQKPTQKSMYVFDVNTGAEPYQVAMGRVSGNNSSSHPPVVDHMDRLLTYWRGRNSTFFVGGSYGTNFCPDFSAMDLNTGDRIKITPAATFCPELDNGFMPTSGGNYLYLQQPFRGTVTVNMTTGQTTNISTPIGCADGTNRRGYFDIIYYGNDSDTNCNDRDPSPFPPAIHRAGSGSSGAVIAQTGNITMLYINETDARAIVAVRHKP